MQRNHVLLRFLKLRVVVNGMHIYTLHRNNPVFIVMPTNPSRIVVTNGFHITRPLELKYRSQTAYFHIACVVENDVLVGVLVFMLMFFAMGATSGVLALQIFSLLPLAYVLFLYYVKRKEFITIKTV